MPTYVYGCDSCSHQFEIFQKFQDAPLTECPQCGARIRRIFQPAGIVFKGSGWYSTDARSGKRATSGDESTVETGATDGKKAADPAPASKGGDAVPAAKSAPSEAPAPAKAAE